MKAIIEKQVSNARNYGGEKETVSKYVVLDKTGKQFVDCRAYMGRSRNSSTVYASIWVNGTNVHTSGNGYATGYGYHKESEAIADAIGNAGITLWGCPYADEKGKENLKNRVHFGGCGETATRVALLAIAKTAGLKGTPIFVSL